MEWTACSQETGFSYLIHSQHMFPTDGKHWFLGHTDCHFETRTEKAANKNYKVEPDIIFPNADFYLTAEHKFAITTFHDWKQGFTEFYHT